MEMFVSGVVGWLIQEAGRSSVRRLNPPVRHALDRAIRIAVPRAAARVFPDADKCEHTVAALLECPAKGLSGPDGIPLIQLEQVVRVWVAGLEHPIGPDGLPERIEDHPLVAPLCDEIRTAIEQEAVYGAGALHPLWSEYSLATSEARILSDLRRHPEATTPSARIDYWHPPVGNGRGFVGRRAELDWLATNVASVRLVHGVGGCGKTALVVAHVDEVVDDYPDGRVFLDFQGHSPHAHHTPKSALEALAELLVICGVPDEQVSGMSLRDRETAWNRRSPASGWCSSGTTWPTSSRSNCCSPANRTARRSSPAAGNWN